MANRSKSWAAAVSALGFAAVLSAADSMDPVEDLRTSTDKTQSLRAAMALARSNAPNALDKLAELLLDPAILHRLDADENGRVPRWPENPLKVVDAMGAPGTSKAESALLRLAGDRQFMENALL